MEAYNARDIGAFIACCHPQIEFHSAMDAVGGAVYHGHDGLQKYHRDTEEAWGDDIRLEPEAYFDLGEHTLAFLVARGRGRQSGADVTLPGAQVLRWRDGLIVFHKGYADREGALSDLDVSADELEPIGP
jgi:ketosteroid isomerase-like protein